MDSIFKIEYDAYNVIAVDNNSENDSIKQIQKWTEEYFGRNKSDAFIYTPLNKSAEYLVIKNDKIEKKNTLNELTIIKSFYNGGYAAGNNIGISYALSRYNSNFYWILNNDTIVEPLALNFVIEILLNKPEVGICGTVLINNKTNKIQTIGGKYNRFFGKPYNVLEGYQINDILFSPKKIKIDYPSGASMVVKKEFIEEVGLMSEKYFLYFEELDWVHRSIAKNWKIDTSLKSKVWHKGGSTINNNESSKSKLSDYFFVRNRVIFARKFYPLTLPFIYISLCWLLLNRLKKRQFDRILYIIKLSFNPNISIEKILINSKR
jgi:GT2 family glycosyltransferase